MLEYGEANVQAHIRTLSPSAVDDGEWRIAQLVNLTLGGKTTGFYFLFEISFLILFTVLSPLLLLLSQLEFSWIGYCFLPTTVGLL